MARTTSFVLVLVVAAAGCAPQRDNGLGAPPSGGGVGGGGAAPGGGDGPPGGGDPVPPAATPQSVSLSGQIVDFMSQAGLPLGTVSAYGVWPVPHVDLYGDTFTVQDVPQHATLRLVVSSDGHLPTWSLPITVGTQDQSGVQVPAVPASWATDLAQKLGITPLAATGIVVVKLVGADGQPVAGIDRGSFTLDADADGPYLIDDQGQPVPDASATSSSGRAVFFSVTPGRVSVVSRTPGLAVGGATTIVTAGGASLTTGLTLTVN